MCAVGFGLLSVSTLQAQSSSAPVEHLASSTPWNFGVLGQGGFGVTEDRSSFKFLFVGVHAGKVLTSQMGSGWLRGNFEYGVEVIPLWQAYAPTFQRATCYATATTGTTLVSPGLYCSPLYTVGGTATGASITPIILRWNLTHGTRWMPWVQGAGGVIWTNHKFPAFGSSTLSLANDGPGTDTSVWNFTPQFGVGAHYFLKPQRSIDFGANAVHISSASLGDKNPGINASVQFSVGYSWWK